MVRYDLELVAEAKWFVVFLAGNYLDIVAVPDVKSKGVILWRWDIRKLDQKIRSLAKFVRYFCVVVDLLVGYFVDHWQMVPDFYL